MAEVSAATGSIGSVRKKLEALLFDERMDFKRVHSEVKPLIHALESLYDCLLKLSSEDEKNLDALEEAWMMDLRERSYDMEDSLDKFIVKSAAEPGSCKKLFKILLTKIKRSINGIVKVIQDIKMPVEELNERMNRYNLSNRHITYDPIKIDSRVTALYVDDSHLVGMDGPKRELIKMLSTEDEPELSMTRMVISIVGPGGLGKTTLAKQVYQHIKAEFHCYVFVSVGQNPNTGRERLFTTGL